MSDALADGAEEMNAATLEREREVQSLIVWATARAGVIVVVPGIGTLALLANEAYMVLRIARLYGVDMSAGALKGFFAGLAGSALGGTLATLFPNPPTQIVIGMGVTYGIGQVANQWLRDGMPEDLSGYADVFDSAYGEVKTNPDAYRNDPRKEAPLGDETAKPF